MTTPAIICFAIAIYGAGIATGVALVAMIEGLR
jgi:hypothetical protein